MQEHTNINPSAQVLTEMDYGEDFLRVLKAAASPAEPFPWPSHILTGPLADAIDWIEASNPRSMRIGALASALVGFSAGLARRVYVRWSPDPSSPPVAVQQPIIVIARTGAGKDAPLRACMKMIALAGYQCLGNLPFHPNRLYSEVLRSGGALGLALDEVDATFASLQGRTEHSSAKEATMKTLLSCKGRLLAPSVGARNGEREALDAELGAGTWAAGIDRPALALLGVSTPNAWDRLAGNVAGGLVGRMLVLDAGSVVEMTSFTSQDTDRPPESVRQWFEALNPSAKYEEVGFVPNLHSDTDGRLERVIQPSDAVLGAYMLYSGLLTDDSNEAYARGDTDYADLLARSIETVCRVAAIFALGVAPDPLTAEISTKHMTHAYVIVRWAVERTAAETAKRNDQSDVARAVQLIRTRLGKPNKIRGVETPWHFSAKLHRGIEAQFQIAIKPLLMSGEVVQDGRRFALAANL
jgi:hypothetical protein